MKAKDFTPHAALCLSNWGGIEIMLDDNCENVYYRWYGILGRKPCRIRLDNEGEPYFSVLGRKYMINDFMLV